MNCDIPYLKCWVRNQFLTGGEGCEEGYAFAISSIPGRALSFHCMLKSGAHYRHLPIHALATLPDAPDVQLGECALWDCFTSRPLVTVFSYLKDHQCVVRLRSSTERGTYLFTVDWEPATAERPGWVLEPDQNKCAHVIALDNGNLCAMPTNRIQWIDGYWIGAGSAGERGYLVQDSVYQAEDAGFDVSEESRFDY